MVKHFKHSHQLLQTAFLTMQKNKKLLIFPMLGIILSSLIMLVVLAPFAAYRHLHGPLTEGQIHHLIVLYLFFFLFLSISHFVLFFFNAAFIFSIQNYFKGKLPSILEGFKAAYSAFWLLALWNTLASTIGIFIFLFTQTARKIKYIDQLLETQTWNIAIYFIIPVMVIEKKLPIIAFRKSRALLQSTWGNHLVSNIQFSWIIVALQLIFLIPLLAGFLIGSKLFLVFGAAVTMGLFLIISVMKMCVRLILCSTLYFYATEKSIPPGFSADALQHAFKS